MEQKVNESMLLSKLLVARGNKYLSNNKKTWLPWETRKIVVASKKKTGSK